VPIEIVQADITTLAVDVIVNAANSSLLGGGGVDGAIHRAAGPDLVHACRLLSGCKTGQAKRTEGFRLPARWIVHTVGPVWRGGTNGEPALLANCYRESLRLSAEVGAQSVAFPAISTGIYKFPIDHAARIAVRTVRAWLATRPDDPRVILCTFRASDTRVFQAALDAQTDQPTERTPG
jgi:O-acetyl-ADP-ribose deacetylase (regulator of RNase III)